MSEDFKVRSASIVDLDMLADEARLPSDVVQRKIGSREFLVAERAETVVGFVQLEYLWSKVPYIALIRVLPGHRRRGVGKGLLRALENRLRIEGHNALYSSSQADEP